MAYDQENIFAKILRGALPCHKVYEDEMTLAFMDVMPQAECHTLIIPKEGAVNILDVSPEALSAVIRTTQKVAQAVKKATGAPGVMVMQLNEREAGQSVFHLHFHVMPRWQGLELKFHARGMEDGAVLAANAAKVRAALEV
jgi:histidine triad (HIT) family protein